MLILTIIDKNDIDKHIIQWIKLKDPFKKFKLPVNRLIFH